MEIEQTRKMPTLQTQAMNEKPCWECCAKRRVCDLAKPQCKKCRARGIQCPGYDKKPLKWLNPGQTRYKGKQATDKLALATVASRRLGQHLLKSTEADTVMQTVIYYNRMVCPDLEALRGDMSRSPYYVPEQYISCMLPAAIESLTCVALGHRILQSADYLDSKSSMVLAKRLQRHRGKAINLLSENLRNPKTKTSDETLVCILIFLLSEIQQSISPTWRQHSDGAQALIELKGGLREMITTRPQYLHMFRYFLLTEIFGATTSPDLSRRAAQLQLSGIDLLPNLFGAGLFTAVPCPVYLLREIIHINYQRALKVTIAGEAEHSASTLRILHRIRRFSVKSWLDEVEACLESKSKNAHFVSQEESTWKWAQIGSAYHEAATLYCISSLVDDDVTTAAMAETAHLDNHQDIRSLRQLCYRSLLNNLRDVAREPTTHVRKLILWPLVIAGIESNSDENGTRSFILAEIAWFARSVGTASALEARDFLQCLWRNEKWESKQTQVNGTKWGALFDRPYMFAF